MSFICFKTVDWMVELSSSKTVNENAHFARLASTEEKHFDLIFRKEPVPLELVLDLIVACAEEGVSAGRAGGAGGAIGG